MKCFLLTITFTVISLTPSACVFTSKTGDESQAAIAGSSAEKLPMEQDDGILSRNYATAERALHTAIAEKDLPTLRRGLRSTFFPIKQRSIEALTETKNKLLVVDLIDALRANQAIFSGGTETEVMQNDFNRSLILAIEKLTGLKFKVSAPITSSEVKIVVEKTQAWWKEHERKGERQPKKP